MKTKIFACICMTAYGIKLGPPNGFKWLGNSFRHSEFFSEDIRCNVIEFRGGGDDNKDDIEESFSIDQKIANSNQEQVDDVEIIPFDDDQFIASDENDTETNRHENEHSSSSGENLPHELEIDDILDFNPYDVIDDECTDSPGDGSNANDCEIVENSIPDDHSQQDKQSVSQNDKNSLSNRIGSTFKVSQSHDDEVLHLQSDSEVLISSNQNDTQHGKVDESSYMIWIPGNKDAYDLKYRISLQLKRWAEKDELLASDDDSKELRLLLHRRAQEYLRDLLAFEDEALAEKSFKNIPQPKRVLHFIAPKIKAIKQSPYISLQIRGASKSDAKVAASTLAVMSSLTELYSIVKYNLEQNAGIFDDDSSYGAFGELLEDRRLQQVVECSLCGFESICIDGRDIDSKLIDPETSFIGENNDVDNDQLKNIAVSTALDQDKNINDYFPWSDATRIVFGLTAFRYNSFANGTDVTGALYSYSLKALEDFSFRFKKPPDINIEDHYRLLSEDVSEFVSIISAASAHFNLQTNRVIKSCFEVLTTSLPYQASSTETNPKGGPYVLLDYLSTENLIKLVEARSCVFSSLGTGADFQALLKKIDSIVKHELNILKQNRLKEREIECVDAASLLDSTNITEEYDEYDDALEVESFPNVELSSAPLSKLSVEKISENASELTVCHEFLIKDIEEHTETNNVGGSSLMVSEKPISFILRRKKIKDRVDPKSCEESSGNKSSMMFHHLSLDNLCSFIKVFGKSRAPVTEEIISLIKSIGCIGLQSASDYELVNLVCVCCDHMESINDANEILIDAMEQILARDVHETLDLADLLRLIESISTIRDPVRFFMNLQNKSKLHLIFDRILRDMPENMPSLYQTVNFIRSYAKWRSWGSRGRRMIGWDRFETLGYLVQHCYDSIAKNENCGSASRRLNCSLILSYAVALLGVEGSDVVHQSINLVQDNPQHISDQKFEHVVGLLFAQAKYIQAIKCEKNKETVDKLIKYACQSESLSNLEPSDYALFIWSIGVLRDTSSEAFDFQKSHNIPVFTRDQLRSLTPAMSIQLVSGKYLNLLLCLS